MSSSGLVPAPSSKRELNEYCPSKAPPPKRIVPLPLGRSPSHRASALRTGMRRTSWEPLNVDRPDATFARGFGRKEGEEAMGTGRSFFARASVTALCALVGTTGAALVAGGTAAAATVVVNCPANTLQSAINAAPSGSTLRVSGTCVGNFTIPAGKNLTLVGPAVLDAHRPGVVLTVAPAAPAPPESTP